MRHSAYELPVERYVLILFGSWQLLLPSAVLFRPIFADSAIPCSFISSHPVMLRSAAGIFQNPKQGPVHMARAGHKGTVCASFQHRMYFRNDTYGIYLATTAHKGSPDEVLRQGIAWRKGEPEWSALKVHSTSTLRTSTTRLSFPTSMRS